MLIRKFVQKYNERNILTLHEIIDCIAEKTVSVIIQLCEETK